MTRFLKAENILGAWEKAIKTVMDYGEIIEDERESETKEIEDLIIQIKNPLQRLSEHPYWYGEKLEYYSTQIQDSDKKGFVYSYGNRLREYFGTDQISEVISRLKKNTNTRRAVMVTFDPILDNENDEIPCILVIQFRIRNNKLNTSVFWRSNDIWGAYYPNIAALSGIIDLITKEINVDVGTLVTHAGSAHIYEVNFEEAQNYINKKGV